MRPHLLTAWAVGAALAATPRASRGAAQDSALYVLQAASRLEVQTGKAGLLGFAGHEHLIRARAFTGKVVFVPSAPAQSRVEITITADSLEVLTPPDTEEIRKVTAAMRTAVLDVARYPEITFVSRSVSPTDSGFRVVGELTLVGRSREVPVEVGVALGPDTLRATTTFQVRQTDFGIRPYRGGPAGTVRVADRVTFRIAVVATRATAAEAPARR